MTPGPSKRCQLVLISAVDSKRLSRVSLQAELLFFKLILLTDDEGRFWGSPFRVAAAAFSSRMEKNELTFEVVGAWLRELENVELVRTYTAEDGDRYLEILRLHRPTKADRERVLRFPKSGTGSSSEPDGVQPDDNGFPTPIPIPTSIPIPTGQEGRPDHVDQETWTSAVAELVAYGQAHPTLGPQDYLLRDATRKALRSLWLAPKLDPVVAAKDPDRARRKQQRGAVTRERAVQGAKDWMDDLAQRALKAGNPVAYLRRGLSMGPSGKGGAQ